MIGRVETQSDDQREAGATSVAAPATVTDVRALTANVVSAHIAHNPVSTDALPALIQSVYRALASAGDVEVTPKPQTPAVPVKKSVFPDYIVCLEDGKKLKMLRRHLRTSFNMTPEQYRIKWNLPANYPMVAPSYANRRSSHAKAIGLGKPRTKDPPVTVLPARRAKGAKR